MKKYIYILALALGVAACNYLEPDNKTMGNQSADEILSKEPADVRVYAYSLMKPVVTCVSLYEDGTDLYIPAQSKSASDFDQYTFNVENATIKSLYSDCYSVINMANCCIYYDKAGEFNAEMRWLRDYCYYILMQQFGGVPYTTEYINSSKNDFPRMDLMKEYEAVIKDLEEIAKDEHLPASSADGHVSVAAVNALLAKVALAAGWDAERAGLPADSCFIKAAKAAENIVGETPIELNLSFADKWSPRFEANEEVIFAVQYDRASWKGDMKTGGHGLQNTFGSYYGDCTATMEKYSDSYHCPSPKASLLWEVNTSNTDMDARWDGTFMTEMLNARKDQWGTEGYYAYYNNANKDTLPIAAKYFPGNAPKSFVTAYTTANASRLEQKNCVNAVVVEHMTYPQLTLNDKPYNYVEAIRTTANGGQWTAPSVKKFDDPSTANIALNKTNSYRDVVVLHKSDIYLVAAEAYLKMGKEDKALACINAVRKRAGVAEVNSFNYTPSYAAAYPNFAAQPIDLILDERARELYAEGHRWMDLRRTGRLVVYNQVFNPYNNGHTVYTLRPIPQAEINANSAMTNEDQNPEWK